MQTDSITNFIAREGAVINPRVALSWKNRYANLEIIEFTPAVIVAGSSRKNVVAEDKENNNPLGFKASKRRALSAKSSLSNINLVKPSFVDVKTQELNRKEDILDNLYDDAMNQAKFPLKVIQITPELHKIRQDSKNKILMKLLDNIQQRDNNSNFTTESFLKLLMIELEKIN